MENVSTVQIEHAPHNRKAPHACDTCGAQPHDGWWNWFVDNATRKEVVICDACEEFNDNHTKEYAPLYPLVP